MKLIQRTEWYCSHCERQVTSAVYAGSRALRCFLCRRPMSEIISCDNGSFTVRVVCER